METPYSTGRRRHWAMLLPFLLYWVPSSLEALAEAYGPSGALACRHHAARRWLGALTAPRRELAADGGKGKNPQPTAWVPTSSQHLESQPTPVSLANSSMGVLSRKTEGFLSPRLEILTKTRRRLLPLGMKEER